MQANRPTWREKLDARQAGDRLEVVIGGHQDVVGRVLCQFQGKGVGVGNFSIGAILSCTNRAFPRCGNDRRLQLSQAIQNAMLLARAKPLAQVPGNLAPLHGRDAHLDLSVDAGSENLFDTVSARLIVNVANYCRCIENKNGHLEPYQPCLEDSCSCSRRRSSSSISVPDGPPAVHPRNSLIKRRWAA